MNNVIEFNIGACNVTFNRRGWINATEFAKANGKRLDVWLKSNETKEYIASLMKHLNTTKRWDLIQTKRGSGGSTWLHPKLAVVFARWISVDFAVQCDMYIDAILFGDMTAYDQYRNACDRLEAAQKEASKCGKGLAKFRWQKPELVHSVGYWHQQLELPLLKSV